MDTVCLNKFMKNYILLSVFSALILSSCVAPVLMSDPPNMYYELDKVEDLLISNSLMFIQNPVVTNSKGLVHEIGFKLFVKNSNSKKSVSLNLKEVRFSYLQQSLGAKCRLDPENSLNTIEPNKDYVVDCKVFLTQEDALKLGKNDLIGELRIPANGANEKYLTSKIYVRREVLK